MPWVKIAAWASLVGNVLIIGTGGAVRLTASGLGCTTWPLCTEGTNDWHAIVEFSNRIVGGLLGVVAILAVIAVWRLRKGRGDLWAHAWILLVGVVVEGLLGALTVYIDLAAWSVGIHFLLSAVLVGVATSFVLRAHRGSAEDAGPRRIRIVPLWMVVATHLASLLLLVLVVLGVLTAGSGPHSGDANVIRDTAGWDALVHAHAWFGYLLAAALVSLLIGSLIDRDWRFLARLAPALLVVALEIVVGVTQARLGIPAGLVLVHMVLAALTIVAAVILVDALKRPAAEASAAEIAADAARA